MHLSTHSVVLWDERRRPATRSRILAATGARFAFVDLGGKTDFGSKDTKDDRVPAKL